MKDKLSEQKVQVRQVRGQFFRYVWEWSCELHDCPAETRRRRTVLFAQAVEQADAHAHRFHGHRHVPHDLPLRCVRCSAPVAAGRMYCPGCPL